MSKQGFSFRDIIKAGDERKKKAQLLSFLKLISRLPAVEILGISTLMGIAPVEEKEFIGVEVMLPEMIDRFLEMDDKNRAALLKLIKGDIK